MATGNSENLARPGAAPHASRLARWLVAVLAGTSAVGLAAPETTPAETPAARVARIYSESRARFQRETNSVVVAWEFGRACFDSADLASEKSHRADFAREGIKACRRAAALDPKSAAVQYYLGLNLGQLALTKHLSALYLLDEMEAAWNTAIALDPKFDYAGAHRSIGLMYRDAPGWPLALGSRKKARLHLGKAVELASDYPDNQIIWLESLLEWGEKSAAQSRMASVEKILADARKRLTGPQWVLSWRDWDERWKKIQARIGTVTLKSPRAED